MKKSRALALLSLTGLLLFSGPALKADAAWKQTSAGWQYTQDASPGYVTGFQKIGKYTYYFDSNGIRQTGIQTIDGKTYYFSSKGRLKIGWFTAVANKKRYYAYSNGVLALDVWVDNCYLQEDGTMAVNTWVDGKWVGSDGKFGGITANIGWLTRNGNTYYYNSQQQMIKGWLTTGGKTYYLQSSTGVLLKGWITVSGKVYYAETKKGVIQKSTWVGNKYLQSNGVMATGLTKIGSHKYLFDSNGEKQTGWVTYNNKIYYCNSKGYVQYSKWIDDKYVTSSGVRASGFVTIKGNTYYFDPSTGSKVTKWQTIDGKRYYFTAKGVLRKNKWLLSKRYYASGSGAFLTGLNAIGSNLYYFDTTTCRKVTSTLKTIGTDTYYFMSGGTAAKNRWVKINGKYYYFKSSGKMAKSTWVGKYYVNASGVRTTTSTQNGWITLNGVKYYFSNSKMVTGWQTISGTKYYFSSTGAMLTGVQSIGSKKYYFYADGALATSITIVVGSKQYVINSSGVITSETSLKVTENTTGDKIVNYALQFVGNPYVYGGTSLTKGADCSGFTQTIFATFGIKLKRVADEQRSGPSTTEIAEGYTKAVVVDVNSMQPGDLIFYGASNYATHVAIYIGNGQIVHASNSQPYPAGGIKISYYNYATPIRVVRYWS